MVTLIRAFCLAIIATALSSPPFAQSAVVAGAGTPAQPTGARPLIILLDTSSSMSDDDGEGTVKLAGAQAALSQVIRQQLPGSTLGLWTFPNDGGCGAGRFVIKPGPLDQRAMIGKIRSLTASGDTPTGLALERTAEQLDSLGYEGATILLISDGLHTCDPDPCEVAKAVSERGFDLTVQAAGFKISDEGMDELRCIASATGGQTYEATDADELASVVADATRAALTIEVTGIPERTPSGSASRVSVKVTNESATDIVNARIAFSFANSTRGGQSIVPAVLPPLVRLGNLPSGTSQSHSWLVSYGSRGKAGTAGYRVSAWGSNAQPAEKTGEVEVIADGLTLADTSGPLADLSGKEVVILGDSYSSGEGAGDYFTGSDVRLPLGGPSLNTCHRSPNTYLYSTFSDETYVIACSGATTHHIGDNDRNGVREEQVPVLAAIQDRLSPASAAFMTVGGNDIEFGKIVKGCLLGHVVMVGLTPTWDTRCSDDYPFMVEVEGLIDRLPSELRPTYEAVLSELNQPEHVDARGGLVATLYILAYPQAFPEKQWISWCRGFDSQEIAYANYLVDRLNGTIERTVTNMRRLGYPIEFISTTQETFLPDNTSCPRPQAVEYMNSVDILQGAGTGIWDWAAGSSNTQEFMHPNKAGYQAETNTVLAWSAWAGMREDQTDLEWNVPDDDGWFSQVPSVVARALTIPLPAAGPATLDAVAGEWVNEPVDARGGQTIDVDVTNAAPGSVVLVTVASRPRPIGAIQIGTDGHGSGTVRIPPRVPAGGHTLTALAFDSAGNPVVASQPIDIARAIPSWLTLVVGSTVIALLVSFLLYRRARRTQVTS